MAALDKEALLNNMLVAVLQVVQQDGPELTGCLQEGLNNIADLVAEIAACQTLTAQQKAFFEESLKMHKDNAVRTCRYQQAELAQKAMDAAMNVLWAALKAATRW